MKNVIRGDLISINVVLGFMFIKLGFYGVITSEDRKNPNVRSVELLLHTKTLYLIMTGFNFIGSNTSTLLDYHFTENIESL